jgi:nucleoside-diphosphate-sugar epimerase/rhodanese-related sulfurtransferase
MNWIDNRIATAPATELEDDSGFYLLDVRDLRDGDGNPDSLLLAKIREGSDILRSGRRLVVCCDYGLSRSNAIAAAILAGVDEVDFRASLDRVLDKTKQAPVRIELASQLQSLLSRGRAAKDASSAKSRVLITGAKGFLGNALKDALEGQVFVALAGRRDIDLTVGPYELARLVEREQIRTIVHLAHPSPVNVNRSIADSLVMLKNVLDVARTFGCRLIYMSGWEVFSGYCTPFPLIATELTPRKPGSIYGMAKALCEQLIEDFASMSGTSYCIVRSGPILGKGSSRPRFFYTFAEHALAGRHVFVHKYRNGLPQLDFLAIEDVITAIVNLIHSDCTGFYHIGSGKLISTTEVASIVIQEARSRSTVVPIELNADTAAVLMDASRIKGELGIALESDPRATVVRFARWIINEIMANRNIGRESDRSSANVSSELETM